MLTIKADVDYDIQVEIVGPDDGDVISRVFHGVDAWQTIRFAFRVAYDLAYSRVSTGSKLTFQSDENWTSEQSVPVPHW